MLELLIVAGVVALLAAIAVPGLLSARRQANQTSAVASLHAIASAQHTFADTCGQGYYASRLTQLATAPDEGGEPFLTADLAAADQVEKSGYHVRLSSGSDGTSGAADACSGIRGGDLSSSFYATASPRSAIDGGYYYWVGVNGTIYESPHVIPNSNGRSEPDDAWPVSEGGANRSGGASRRGRVPGS